MRLPRADPALPPDAHASGLRRSTPLPATALRQSPIHAIIRHFELRRFTKCLILFSAFACQAVARFRTGFQHGRRHRIIRMNFDHSPNNTLAQVRPHHCPHAPPLATLRQRLLLLTTHHAPLAAGRRQTIARSKARTPRPIARAPRSQHRRPANRRRTNHRNFAVKVPAHRAHLRRHLSRIPRAPHNPRRRSPRCRPAAPPPRGASRRPRRRARTAPQNPIHRHPCVRAPGRDIFTEPVARPPPNRSHHSSMRVPSTPRNAASHAGIAGHAGAVTRLPSVTAASIATC